MKCFRVFFKKYNKTAKDVSDNAVEFKEKKFKTAYEKAEKMGKKKGMRVVMIAEIDSIGAFPETL